MYGGGGASRRLKVRQLTTGWCRDDGGGTKTTLPAMREYSFYKREQRWRRAYLRIESSTGRWPPPSANRRGCRPPRAPLGRLEAPPPRLHPPRQADQAGKSLLPELSRSSPQLAELRRGHPVASHHLPPRRPPQRAPGELLVLLDPSIPCLLLCSAAPPCVPSAAARQPRRRRSDDRS
jgi:hypothetical protein